MFFADKVFLASVEGKITVLKAAGQWQLLGVNDIGEKIHSTPALNEGRIDVRTRSSVYCFGVKCRAATRTTIVRNSFISRLRRRSMRAPDFVPTFVKPDGTWGSIGSGARHNWAPHFADNNAFMTVFAHGEVMNPGGAATMVAHAGADSLEREPMDFVSPIIQVGIVRPATHEMKILRRQHQGPWTIAEEEDVRPDELIRVLYWYGRALSAAPNAGDRARARTTVETAVTDFRALEMPCTRASPNSSCATTGRTWPTESRSGRQSSHSSCT